MSRWGVGHPRTVLAIAAVAAALSVLGLARLRIDPDIASLLPSDDPTLRLTRQLQGDAPPSRTLVVVLRAADSRTLDEALPGAVERLRTSPYLARVTATREEMAGPRTEWVRRAPLHFLPEETLARLRARLAGPERRPALEEAMRRLAEDPIAGKEIALRDPLGVRWIFDEAADAVRLPAPLRAGSPYLVLERPPLAFVHAVGRKDSYDLRFTEELLADVRARLAGTTTELAGGYVTAAHQGGTMRRDMMLQSASSALLVIAFLAWFTRSMTAPVLLLLPVALAIAATLAIGGLLLGPLTPLAVSSAAILIAQGIDFTIHLFSRFSRFRQERRSVEVAEAAVRASLSLGRPLLGAAATTMAAFLALLLSRFPGFRQFGLLLFLGVGLCLLFSLALFPVLLLAMGRQAPERPPWGLRVEFRRAAAPLLLIAALAAWVVVIIRPPRADLDLRRSMAPGDPGLAAMARLEAELGMALGPVYALVDARMPVEELRTRLGDLAGRDFVAHASGIHDILPSMQTAERVDRFRRDTSGWIDSTLAEMAALGFHAEPFRRGLDELGVLLDSPAPTLGTLALPEFAGLRRGLLAMEGGREHFVVTLFPRRAPWSPKEREGFDRTLASRLSGSGEVRLFSAYHLPDHYSRALEKDLATVTLATAAGVILLTLLSIGGFRDGLLALVPVSLAAGIALAACSLGIGAINPMNFVALPVIVGIGVDSGIHYMSRRRRGGDADQALADVGPGVWGSTATTLLGFGSIATAATPGLASMGLLVALGAVASFAATFLLLPAISRLARP